MGSAAAGPFGRFGKELCSEAMPGRASASLEMPLSQSAKGSLLGDFPPPPLFEAGVADRKRQRLPKSSVMCGRGVGSSGTGHVDSHKRTSARCS